MLLKRYDLPFYFEHILKNLHFSLKYVIIYPCKGGNYAKNKRFKLVKNVLCEMIDHGIENEDGNIRKADIIDTMKYVILIFVI